MSWVADAKAVMINSTNVSVNILTGVLPEAIMSGEGCGRVNVSKMKAKLIRACIITIHQRLVRRMSTNGLHRGLMTHGRYNKLVNMAMSPLGTPILVNMITDMLLTIK